MGVQSQCPWPLPRPALNPLGAPQSQTCRGAPPLQGALGLAGRGPPIKKSLPTLGHPEQPPSASAITEPLPQAEPGGTDRPGRRSVQLWPCGATWSEGHPHPDPRLLRPPPSPSSEAGYRHPREAPGEMVLWSERPPPATAGVLSAPCPQTRLLLVPQPRVPDLCGTKDLGAGCPPRQPGRGAVSPLPCPTSLPGLGPNPLPSARPVLLPLTGKYPQRPLDSHLRPLPSGPSWPDGMDPTQNHN